MHAKLGKRKPASFLALPACPISSDDVSSGGGSPGRKPSNMTIVTKKKTPEQLGKKYTQTTLVVIIFRYTSFPKLVSRVLPKEGGRG